ncbi:hypothetical protein SAVERM_2493 [Streptomyces avermitilis MA-4680 = NBRC 14893]|uniref:Uncharacterized protein n=2 Tax=Streptomyces avermitilis TaxID=33903 RepID=Q82KB0_STRAW|nr:hypothetical protein SAVERM_2493 [Streptomyces avermitilis MA-4680 = NBRC 14893]
MTRTAVHRDRPDAGRWPRGVRRARRRRRTPPRSGYGGGARSLLLRESPGLLLRAYVHCLRPYDDDVGPAHEAWAMENLVSPAVPGAASAARKGPRRRFTTRPAERFCYATGALLVLSGLAHLVVFAVDGGPWDGPVSWRKPVTFGLSFGLTLVAVTWVTSYLRVGARLRTALLVVFAADCVVEVGGITLQAWRRAPSHLNMETGFDTLVSMTLAVGGGVLVVVLSVFAAAAFRHRPEGPVGMPLALRSGFAILVVALLSGAAMIARGVVLTRTGHQEAAYHSTAPLKPLHGVSLHAVLVLPALASLLSRTPWSDPRKQRLMYVAVGAYAVAVLAAGVWAVLTY